MAKTYKIIYADPPWPYQHHQSNENNTKDAYKSMTMEEIKTLPIQKLCDKDCLLFLWATMPKLQEALDTLKSWGFDYITTPFVWVKQNPKNDKIYSGMGYWTNSNVEIVLLGKKGSPKRVKTNIKQIVMAHRGKHSAKPNEVRNRIVELMGDVPRIELFAREKVKGWDSHGNEIKNGIKL